MHSIPLIDIAELLSADPASRQRVASTIGRACRDVGFFAITGHGVPAATLAAAFDAAREFFMLDHDVKDAFAIGRHGSNRGYVGLGVESLDATGAPDQKEAFNLIWTDAVARPPNLWPTLPLWRERTQACFDALLGVGRRLHRAFALDLGLQETFFDDKLDRPMAALRLLRYPARGDNPLSGAGVHTDYGNVTLLATDGVAGLQVRQRDGTWVDAPTLPGAFICNIGDCLMRWSNDVYVSTPHRVQRPLRERYSIAFFLDPNPDALVSAFPQCVPSGEAPRYEPITAAEHLAQRFAATYSGNH